MSILGNDELKEKQKLRELEQAINREKQKVDKKLTRQKILLGAFIIDALEKNEVQGLRDYVARELPDYLTRATDKELLKGLVENLGGTMEDKKEEPEHNQHNQGQHQQHDQHNQGQHQQPNL